MAVKLPKVADRVKAELGFDPMIAVLRAHTHSTWTTS